MPEGSRTGFGWRREAFERVTFQLEKRSAIWSRENMLVHVPKAVEIGREEDVEVTLLDEQGGTGYHRALIPRLDDGRIVAFHRVRKRRKVGKD